MAQPLERSPVRKRRPRARPALDPGGELKKSLGSRVRGNDHNKTAPGANSNFSNNGRPYLECFRQGPEI